MRSALTAALGETGAVRSLVPKTSLEIWDLNRLTEARDVVKALLKRDFPNIGDFKVRGMSRK